MLAILAARVSCAATAKLRKASPGVAVHHQSFSQPEIEYWELFAGEASFRSADQIGDPQSGQPSET